MIFPWVLQFHFIQVSMNEHLFLITKMSLRHLIYSVCLFNFCVVARIICSNHWPLLQTPYCAGREARITFERKTSFWWNWYLANNDSWQQFGNGILAAFCSLHLCLASFRKRRQLASGTVLLQLCLHVPLTVLLGGPLVSLEGGASVPHCSA